MNDRAEQNDKDLRTIEVDMSSEAIAQRIRDASELNELGLSLAKAKPCSSPYEPAKVDAAQAASPLFTSKPATEE